MMVEIEQVEHDFAIDLKVKTLNAIDPTHNVGWCPDVPDEKCIFLEEGFSNFGDTVQFVDDNSFCLNLFTDLPQKAARGLNNQQAWMIFAVNNIKPLKRGAKCQMYGNIIVSAQNYLLELDQGCDSGYIQFFCLTDVARCDGQLYKQNSLMHVSVHRSRKACRVSPAVITVKPNSTPINENLYVSILPGQRLQIVTPVSALVDSSTPKLRLVDAYEKTLCHNSRVSCTVLECDSLLDRGEIITVTSGRRRQSIWTTGLISSTAGEIYPMFNKPDRKTHLICYNMNGFAITNDSDPNWLIDDFADINQNGECTIVTFTKPQKSVSIERTDNYWWLSGSKAHALETVT